MDQLQKIKSKIYEIRGRKVMLDTDLAELYEVETKNLKRAVRANIERFPDDFMFELTKEEYNSLRCKNFTIKNGRGQHSKYLPFAFTREGIALLSGLLRSPIAIQANINIMRAFTEFRHMASTLSLPSTNADVAQLRKDFEELKLDIEDILHDQNDINEATRAQLDAISTALSELQSKEPRKRERRPIGFIVPDEKKE